MSKSIRLTANGAELNVMVANLVTFAPHGETGSILRISTGDAIVVDESNRSIRSKLKKLNETAEAED